MGTSLFFLFFGFLLLIKGGGWFVEASIRIAHKFHIPRIVVGGTIVSLATTSPETAVSVTASALGNSGVALGNAVGSVIVNTGLIVGICAGLNPITVDKKDFRRRSSWMLAAAMGVTVFSLTFGLNRITGLILLLGTAAYFFVDYRLLVSGRSAENQGAVSEPEDRTSSDKSGLKFLIGAGLVLAGSRVLIAGAEGVAYALGIPSLVFGLTIIAFGTSLPELTTGIIAAKKNASDLSIGNIVGANIINLGGITGLAALVRPLSVDTGTLNYSFFWLFILIFTLMIFFWQKGRIQKAQGIVLVLLYAIYTSGLVFLSFCRS